MFALDDVSNGNQAVNSTMLVNILCHSFGLNLAWLDYTGSVNNNRGDTHYY